MWNESGRPSSIGLPPERVVHRGVVVLDGRVAGHHHAAQAELRDALELADAVFDRAHRELAAAEQPRRVRRAVLGQPAVVGGEAGLLELEVGMVADHHADGRVDHFGGDAVAILLRHARRGVPAAAVHLVEAHAGRADLLRRLAGRRHEPHRHRRRQTLDEERVAELVHVLHHRRLRLPLRLDVVDVGVRRLGDVGVGGDDGVVHGVLLRTRRPAQCNPR